MIHCCICTHSRSLNLFCLLMVINCHNCLISWVSHDSIYIEMLVTVGVSLSLSLSLSLWWRGKLPARVGSVSHTRDHQHKGLNLSVLCPTLNLNFEHVRNNSSKVRIFFILIFFNQKFLSKIQEKCSW